MLHRDQGLWRPRPFMDPEVPWRDRLPDTHRWLLTLDVEAIDRLDREMRWPDDAPSELRALGAEVDAAMAPLRRPLKTAPLSPPRRLLWRVPGRKWTQIEALAAVATEVVQTLTDEQPLTEVVDWCSGKGHLGRLVAHVSGLSVRHLEFRADLCAEGRTLAERAGMLERTRFDAVDVLADASAKAALGPHKVAIGLHACGALSTTLVQAASERELDGLVLSTCCYHKLRDGQTLYQPASRPGRELGLELDRGALRLPTADEVNAGRARRQRRRRELAWRQGLQLLIAEASGDASYRALGPSPRKHLHQTFARFCVDVAAQAQLPLPARWSPDRAEAAGWERARRARALALVRGLYRRPMETWLIGDQAVALGERGYDTAVGIFCDRRITPRNLAVTAHRRKVSPG